MQNPFSTVLRAPFWLLSAALLTSGCTQRKEPFSLQQPIQSVHKVGAKGSALPVADSTPPPLPALIPVSAAQEQLLRQAQSEAAIWATQFASTDGKTAAPVGLIVAEPRTEKNAKDEARQFAAGCARWLHLNASGQGALNGTPLWGQADDARRILGRQTLQFASADLPVLARNSGVSHIALGQWQENAGRATLTYQLWRTTPPANTGKSFAISGNRAQIVAQLPALATKISRAVGVAAPEIADIKATPAELTFLGSVPWKAENSLDEKLLARLQVLASREPVAALLLMRNSDLTKDERTNAVSQMVKLAPRNTLVLGDAAWLNAAVFLRQPALNALLQNAQKKQPQNFLLATARYCTQRIAGDRSGERQWIERAVRNAPRNSIAWSSIANTFGDQAEDVRQSRFAPQVNSREWKYLQAVYPAWLNAYLEATRLNPANASAWKDVACAACFNNRDAVAEAAFWKALHLAPHDSDIVSWGLQMYQPKWNNEPDKILLLAQLVENDPVLLYDDFNVTMYALQEVNRKDVGLGMRDRLAARFQQRIAKNPRDAVAHHELAYLARDYYLEAQNDLAAREFEAYLKLRPDDAGTHVDCGRMLHYKMRLYRRAESHYRQALKINPDLSPALCALADLTYYVHQKPAEAAAMYRRSIAIDNSATAHAELARLLLDQGKKGEAYRETQAAVAAGFTDETNPIFQRLNTSLAKFQNTERDSWQY